MQVLLLANETPEDFASREGKENTQSYMGAWYAYSEEMGKAGVTIAAAALETPQTATVVSIRDGVRRVEDGPYADAKEQLGGFFIVDVPDMESAIEWAAKCPASKTGFVDARIIPTHEEHAK